jgi:SAM-dependent methyltransferase
MRVFEALACGSLLITNDLADNGQSELFQSGVHLETYRDADEVIEKIRYYLTHEDTRERIAAAGRADVLATHTYRHRMETLLERVQGFSVPARRGSEFRVQKGRDQKSEGTGKRSEDRGKISGVENQIDGLSCPPSRQLDATSPRPGGPRQSTLDPRPIRDHSYFAHCRPEVVGLLPETARQVLDIGCGAGRVGETIKQRQQAHVTGIELDAAAAALAKMRLDRVLEGNIEHMTLPFEPAEFDAVVCGDILEHLRDPLVLLRKVRTWLRPGGCIVASIPNVRHHSVVRGLINGNWTYESAGLLDGDHVRFFTRREIEKLFFRAGFDLLTTQVVPGPGYEEWVGQGKPGEVKVGRLHIGALATEEAEEFYVYQYLLVATPSSASAVRAAENSTLNVPEPQDDSSTGANLKSLAAAHPWPTLKPNVGLPQENVGWLEDGARQVLTQAISPETKLVVELGTWLGKSTRFIADLAPSAVVIAIDHWIIGIYTTIRF